MVRRRGDEGHAGRGMPRPRDPRPDLAAGQMAALAGLGALRQLDLDLLRAHKIFARHAEAAGGDLLDGGVFLGAEPRGLLAALAGVGLSAQSVHGGGQAAVRLLGDGAVGHGSGLKAPDDARDGLDLAERDGFRLIEAEAEQTAQRMRQLLVVDHGGVAAEAVKIAGADRLLQREDGQGVIHMVFHVAAGAELMEAGGIDGQVGGQIHGIVRPVMPPEDCLVDLLQTDAADAADGVGKIAVHHVLADADGLKDLRALVRLHAGNAHLGGDAHHAVQNRLVVRVDGGVIVLVERPARDERADAVLREIGVDGARAVAEEGGEVVHIARLCAFEDDGDRGALLRAHQILLHGGDRQQRRDGDMVLIHAAVGEDEDVRARVIRLVAGDEKPVERKRERGILVVQQRDLFRLQARHMEPLDLHEIAAGKDGVVDLQDAAVFRAVGQQIAVGAGVDGRIGDDRLAQRVDGRVRDLREHLLEVVEQRLVLFRQHGQRDIRAHGGRRLRAVFRHGQNGRVDLVVGVAEDLIQAAALLGRVFRDLPVGDGDIGQLQQLLIEPFAVGILRGVAVLDRRILEDRPGPGVDEQHLARLQAGFAHDLLRRDRQRADLGGEDQIAVVRDQIPRRAQPVAVEHGADLLAVGEEDGGRAVPGLHHGGVVVEHVALFPGHVFIFSPGLGDAEHQGLRQLDAAVHEKFQRVVEHGGVGAVGLHDGVGAGDRVAEDGGRHRLLAGEHPVDVAADGVDLAVVEDDAVRVRPLPRGRGVGGEAGVDEREGGGIVRVLQIRIELPQLPDQKQALIDDRPAGHGHDVGAGDGVLILAPGQIQPAVKIQPARCRVRAADEALRDVGHAAPGLFAQDLRTDRHVPPEQQLQPLAREDHLQQLPAAHALERVLREEDHGRAVIARVRERLPRLLRRLLKQRVRQLRHDADAVAGGAVGVLAGAVRELFDDLQRAVERFMCSLSADIDNSADAAGVMLRLLLQRPVLVRLFHGFGPFLYDYNAYIRMMVSAISRFLTQRSMAAFSIQRCASASDMPSWFMSRLLAFWMRFMSCSCDCSWSVFSCMARRLFFSSSRFRSVCRKTSCGAGQLITQIPAACTNRQTASYVPGRTNNKKTASLLSASRTHCRSAGSPGASHCQTTSAGSSCASFRSASSSPSAVTSASAGCSAANAPSAAGSAAASCTKSRVLFRGSCIVPPPLCFFQTYTCLHGEEFLVLF